MRLQAKFVLALLLLAAIPTCTFGQSTFATITGNVTDSTGAVLPGVEIVAVHKTLGLSYSARANEAGVYTLPEIREGEYTVRARKDGFKEYLADNISLETRTVRRLDVRMEVGTLQESIEVVAEAGAIETERAVIAGSRSERELQTLPISANSLYYMFMTLPMTQPRGSSPSFAGTRNDQYQMSVDGGSINSGTGGVISNLAGQTETFKEMKVEMVNNTAEHSGLGHVLLVTKSGENAVHGSAFYNYQSPAFRARDFFAVERDAGIAHEFGVAGGGPLYIPKVYNGKNRTFWYVTADTQTASELREELAPNVPIEPWRAGDFSALNLQIRNPLNGDIYRDGRIPAQFINPVSSKIQEWFYPLPNVGDPSVFRSRNHLTVVRGKAHREWHGTAKLDHKVGESDYVFASYGLHQVDVNDWDGSLPALGWKYWKRGTKSATFGHTHMFSPNLLNELRVTHAFNSYPRRGPLEGREVVGTLGLQGLDPNLPEGGGLFKVSFSGVGITAISQTDQLRPGFVNNNTNIHDDVSFFRGKHNIRAGAQLGMIGLDNGPIGSSTFGNVQFANTFSKVPGVSASGHPYADFLFGIPTSMSRSSAPPPEMRRRNLLDLYVQDEWKATSRLTVTLGLRYEYHAPWHDKSGLMATFHPTSGKVAVADKGLASVSPFVPDGYVDIVAASSLGLPATTLIHSDKNDFAPRVGLAFRPFSNNRTVFRGGYGIFYDMTPFTPSTAGSPFVVDEPSFTNPTTPVVVFPQVFPAASTGKQKTISLPSAFNAHMTRPYTQQWSFTIEHERWNTGFRASYVGTATRQMVYGRDMNAPMPDGRLYIEKARPFSIYPGITFSDNGASHTYNGLSLQASRKMRQGIQYQASYTWARDLGDDTGLENPFDRRRERGPDPGLPNQRFVGIVMYELPFGRGAKLLNSASRPLNLIAGGWELSLITYQQTGQHLTPVISLPDPAGTRYTTSGNRPTVTIRPDVIGNPYLDNPTHEQWFDINAFARPAVGGFGNAGNGIITGPGGNVFHAAIHKVMSFTGSENGPRLRVGLVATNVFNHTNFSNPVMNVSTAGTAGTISSVGGPNGSNPGDRAAAREMFLRMRLEW